MYRYNVCICVCVFLHICTFVSYSLMAYAICTLAAAASHSSDMFRDHGVLRPKNSCVTVCAS